MSTQKDLEWSQDRPHDREAPERAASPNTAWRKAPSLIRGPRTRHPTPFDRVNDGRTGGESLYLEPRCRQGRQRLAHKTSAWLGVR